MSPGSSKKDRLKSDRVKFGRGEKKREERGKIQEDRHPSYDHTYLDTKGSMKKIALIWKISQ